MFYELLIALGFRVSMLSGCVRRDDGGFGPEFDHMLLKVELPDPWLADVGFGESFVDPLPLKAGARRNRERSYVRRESGKRRMGALSP